MTRLCALLLLCFAAAPRIAVPAEAGSPLVVCLGDSLTEGYQVDPGHSFPSVVESRLRERGWPDLEVVNAGISGSTTASALSRLEWQLRRKFDVLVLALGANDGLRGIAPETIKANLASAIDLAKSRGVAVLLAGMKLPPNYGPEYTAAFERVFPELAAEKAVPLIPFLLAGVAAEPDLNLPDGIHPTARGYSIVANTVIEHLAPLLASDGKNASLPDAAIREGVARSPRP